MGSARYVTSHSHPKTGVQKAKENNTVYNICIYFHKHLRFKQARWAGRLNIALAVQALGKWQRLMQQHKASCATSHLLWKVTGVHDRQRQTYNQMHNPGAVHVVKIKM